MRGRITAAATAAVLLAALVAGYLLYVAPRTDTVSAADPVDAILALGGDSRVATDAYRLAATGAARVVVISNPYNPKDATARAVFELCRRPPGAGVTVVCFSPDPATTQGEARELGRLAAERGWRRVAVMAPTFHVTRARMIVGRCFAGAISMVAAPEPYSAAVWLYQFAYQTGAFAKSFTLTRTC